MFKLIDSIPLVNTIWFDTAYLDETPTNIELLQTGGFIYLTSATTPGGQKIAKMAGSAYSAAATDATAITPAEYQTRKLVYPIHISREQDANFNPIGPNKLITFINSVTGYEGWVNADSYHTAGDAVYPTPVAGSPLLLKVSSQTVGGKSKLVVPNADDMVSAPAMSKVVAYALSAVVNGQLKIKWVG